jgi:dolichol-phosphate mannosyltransferase
METLPADLRAPRGPYVVAAAPESDEAHRIDVSLILPTFNEARNIRSMLHAAFDNLNNVRGLRFEIIVVDDNSPDGTAQVALEEALGHPEMRVIRRLGEAGLATAVIRGWQASSGDILAVMDADLQHPAAVLTELLGAIRTGADLSVGSRHVGEGGVSDWCWTRRIISRTAQFIGLVLLPEVVGRISDPMSGYFMLRRSAIVGKSLNPTGYKILIEILARGTFARISEIGYIFRERSKGESKISVAVYLQYLQHLLRLRAVLSWAAVLRTLNLHPVHPAPVALRGSRPPH